MDAPSSQPPAAWLPDSGTASVADTPSSAEMTAASASQRPACFHCGLPCVTTLVQHGSHAFCCPGCLAVYALLTGHGLESYYRMNPSAGRRPAPSQPRFEFLDEPATRQRLVDYSDAQVTRMRFRIPAIHCIACVWLLENLYRLQPGIGGAEVHFGRRELRVAFDPARLRLSEVASLLSSLGYEPDLTLADLDAAPRPALDRRLWRQLGVAGFAFGNTMIFSLPAYFGLNRLDDPGLARLFGWYSLALSLPVLLFSARDYWMHAWTSLRQRRMQIEVPIALGLAALFGQSVHHLWTGTGEGYFDSFTGLVFFLLIGRAFQQKTYQRLVFDRDYRAFFPLSVQRRRDGREERVSLDSLEVGDRLILRHGELLPGDARLVEGPALLDYSFVTGEAEPVTRQPGDHLYAGGRQVGGAIEVDMVKPVSGSYLASLWNQEAFRKNVRSTFRNLTNRISRHFTLAVVAVALAAGLYWWMHNGARALSAPVAVLIVACPCALALAAPFALGTAQRELARRSVFLRSTDVVESMARVDEIIFDKTGTLTAPGTGVVNFHGPPLGEEAERWVYSLTRHSTHPHAVRIGESLETRHYPEPLMSFVENAGQGMEGRVHGHELWMGSAAWLISRGVAVPAEEATWDSAVQVAIDGAWRGCFRLTHPLRAEVRSLPARLAKRCRLALLSGDQPRERDSFRELFGPDVPLHFLQTPQGKLDFVAREQAAGRQVMMVGDGLNDAGALRQSDVGVAVVEKMHAFSPASDVILAASMVPALDRVLAFARSSVGVVRACLLLSVLYNLVGVTIAAQGRLSPVICAILMPLSSITVVVAATGLTSWRARRLLPRAGAPQEEPA